LGRDWVAKSTYSLVNTRITAGWGSVGGQLAGAFHGFEGDVDDLADEAEDVLGVVFVVGVVEDAGALAGGDLVLVLT
jgi:voltage-gated potassium channel Kch